MYNKDEIRKRLAEIINNQIENGKFYELCGFYVANFNEICSKDNLADKLADKLLEASKETKNDFMDTFDVYANDKSVRVCDICGKFMVEGYYLAGDYICSDDCAVELYGKGNDNSVEESFVLFQEDLKYDQDNDIGECFWTEW